MNKNCCTTTFILTYGIKYVKYSLRFILSKKKAHVSFPDVLIIITPIPYCSLCHRQYLRYLETKFTTASLAKDILLCCIHYIQDRVRSLCTLLFFTIIEMKIYFLSEDQNTDIVSLVHYFSIYVNVNIMKFTY